jgi:hypothetical protein
MQVDDDAVVADEGDDGVDAIDTVDHLSLDRCDFDVAQDDDNEDNMINNVSSNDSTVPVGITIAYKRYVNNNDSTAATVGDETILRTTKRYDNKTEARRSNSMKKGKSMKQKHPKIIKIKGSKSHESSSYNSNTKKSSGHKSFQVLFESSLIYIICIIIPPLIAYVYNNVIQEIHWNSIISVLSRNNNQSVTPNEPSTSSISTLSWSYNYSFKAVYDYLQQYDSFQYIESTWYDPLIDYMCTDTHLLGNKSSSYFNYYSSYLWESITEQSGLCSGHIVHPKLRRRSIISEDMSAYMDVIHIVICSFLLAVVRLIIVHYTILHGPSNVSNGISNVDSFTILVRCKSNHLLGSDYNASTLTPKYDGTPEQYKQRRMKRVSSDDIKKFVLPDLHTDEELINEHPKEIASNNGKDENDSTLNNSEMFGYHIDISERQVQNNPHNNESVIRMNALAVGIPTYSDNNSTHSLIYSNEQDNEYYDNSGDIKTHTGDDGNIRGDMVFKRQPLELLDSSVDEERQRRKLMYAASRYATAIFRLLYCTVTAGIALLFFRRADFWPWFVLGTGRGTKQCWDLSGGLTVGGMDSDFDQHNAVLKRYFLWQASYHIHSSTFHFLLSLLYIFYPFVSPSESDDHTTNESLRSPSSPAKRFHGFKRGSYAYVRSFIQHLLSVMLIAVAYIFSSLRRLGAIGLFAFDVSSWSLHLLQICVNAPDDSYLWHILPKHMRREKKAAVIRAVYWFIVMPSFLTARFFIWPTLWYSATYESQSWIRQLEMTLWPGSAFLLRCILHTLMLILHGLSILYLRRLLAYRLESKY